MKTKTCSYCAMSIPAAASVCPYCRKKLGFTLGKLFGILILVGILMATILPRTARQEPAPVKTAEQIAREKESQERYEAKLFARHAVELTLKAPASAKWPSMDSVIADRSVGNTWLVYGHVDAQNSFGALLRNNYKLTVSKFKDEWKVLDAKFY